MKHSIQFSDTQIQELIQLAKVKTFEERGTEVNDQYIKGSEDNKILNARNTLDILLIEYNF